MLLFLSAGALLLRLDARQFLSLLFQEPPRRTPDSAPWPQTSSRLDYHPARDE